MTYTPVTGDAVDNLRNSIAASSTWQALVGVSTEAAALPSVLDSYANDKNLTEADFPRVVLSVLDESEDLIATATYSCQGVIRADFQFVTPSEYDRPIAMKWIRDQCRQIKRDIRAKGRQGGNYLNVMRFQLGDGENSIGELDVRNGNIRLGKNVRLWGAEYHISYWGASA